MKYFLFAFLFSTQAMALDASVHAIRSIGLPPARSDVAPESVTITPSPVYQVPNPTNGTGANINMIPSPGERTLVVTNFALTGADTLTIVTVDMQGASTTTTLTEGVAYACAAAGSNAACALAIKTALDAHATLGPALNLVCTDGTCSDATIGFHVTSGITAWLSVTSSDATGLTVTSGTDGTVQTRGIVATGPISATGNATISGALYLGSFSSFYAGSSTVRLANLAGNGAACYGVYPQTITCADGGADAGAHSTCGGAVTITSNIVGVTCADADGCTLTLAETNFSATVTGQITIMMSGANHVDLADSAGVLELDGGAAFAMAAGDTIDLMYDFINLAWRERGRHTDA